MNTLNRTIAPNFNTVEKIEMVRASEKKLSNGISVFSVNAGTQEVVKVEFLFAAGMYEQHYPLQATTTNTIMEEGTSKMNANQIAEAVDYYGAFLETSVAQDNASIVLYTLNKHLAATLPIVEQIIKDAIFPEHEIDIHLKNKKQKFLVNNQKVATIARKRFAELVFGEKHPYGIDVKEKDFETLTRQYLIDFYKKHYLSNNCKIILAGKINDSVYALLEKHFGGNDWDGNALERKPHIETDIITEKTHLIFKEDALQSAIRIGKIMFNKTHPDFQALQVLNTVFGGYFGSRLMSNIREDKGYTYGIGSGLVSLKHSGYFFISTEVGVDVCAKAVDEIYYEMNRLREETVTDEELELVQNYMLGTFLRSVDGPFAMADRFKSIVEYGLGYDYFDKYIATVKNISASELRSLANKYFSKESMIELVVGKK
jgi:predicted Zn-dependent peptidase